MDIIKYEEGNHKYCMNNKTTFNNSISKYLEALINDSDIISFDIFDTLIFRNVVCPTDIFKIVARKIEKVSISCSHFYEMRIKAEESARSKSSNNEVNLDDIYRQFKDLTKCAESERIKKIELETELEFCVANSNMLGIFEFAKNQNKKVLLITDMYLSYNFINQLLIKNNIVGYDHLYVSNKVGVTKADGTLYDYVKSVEKITHTSRWLHIGDNVISDVKNAMVKGIKTFHYQRRYCPPHQNNLSNSVLMGIAFNQAESTIHYWEAFGARISSLIHIPLVFWLINELKGQDNIYFLARDGYIPYQLFCKAQDKGWALNIKPTYLLASRRAYLYPSLLKEDKAYALEMLSVFNGGFNEKKRVREILENLKLEPIKFEKQLLEAGIQSFDECITEQNIGKVKVFIDSIWQAIAEQLEKEDVLLRKYLQSQGIFETETINIFDIGWRGTTHKALETISDKTINGFYFGTNANFISSLVERSKSYCYEKGKPIKRQKIMMKYVMLLEFIFSSPHGSLLGFSEKNGDVMPIFEDNQSFITNQTAMNDIQAGIYQVFHTLLESSVDLCDFDAQAIYDYFERFCEKPDLLDLYSFSSIQNATGMGKSQDIKSYVTVVSQATYESNRSRINKEIAHNFWPDQLLVYDKNGFYGLGEHTHTMRYKLAKGLDKYSNLAVKAIKNPKKVIKKIREIGGLYVKN